MNGVRQVTVGYAGGKKEFPTYRSIKDHTEAVRVEYDPAVISYAGILQSYFDQVGGSMFYPSFSRQYRNAILVHNDEQRRVAKSMISKYAANGREVHLAIEDATDFYRGEEYHQKYLIKSQRSSL
mmetsp:Transcript_20907/g.30106  ORF Transcript_20907/g.30106 Transcript_20907/m.30106 type:complete len:125 (-) Transcript_20907:311-685(-)